MKLYNTLTRSSDEVTPLHGNTISIYSCGPTVYDHIHIGNLSAFIMADTLRRALHINGYRVQHVMNFTDVDDKTIRRSREKYPELKPKEALTQLTTYYGDIFLEDMQAVGNNTTDYKFVKATDKAVIEEMQELIRELHQNGFAYIADDGVYFSIDAYKKDGKVYGQLSEISANSTSEARIQNDEYDKESAHDFALWKKQKDGEPAWDFELDGQNLSGRPGWHIECSIMSSQNLGQPFDIHTGGIDLIFPHHENEIAQSTAGKENPVYANYFVHNEHILVDGKKMSKSLNNFYTLQDIIDKGFDPLAMRVLALQSHYRSQAHFSWENLLAAQNRLKSWQALADLQFQAKPNVPPIPAHNQITAANPQLFIRQHLADDLDTPQAILWLDRFADDIQVLPIKLLDKFTLLLEFFDSAFGLQLSTRRNISSEESTFITQRDLARDQKDWAKSDVLRDKLLKQGIGLRDTSHGAIWYRV